MGAPTPATPPSKPARPVLRAWAIVGYAIIFGLAALIALGYVDRGLRVDLFDAALPGFYGHASNLALSCCLVLVYGLVRIVTGGGLTEIALFALAVIAANYGYELFLTLWNTLDLVDAHYGAAGAILTFAFIAAVHRWGLRPAVG